MSKDSRSDPSRVHKWGGRFVVFLFLLILFIGAVLGVSAIQNATALHHTLGRYRNEIVVSVGIALLFMLIPFVVGIFAKDHLDQDSARTLPLEIRRLSRYPLTIINHFIVLRDPKHPFDVSRGDTRNLLLFNWIFLSTAAVLLVPPGTQDAAFNVTNTLYSAIGLWIWVGMNFATDLGSMLWTRWRIETFLDGSESRHVGNLAIALLTDSVGSLLCVACAMIATNFGHVMITGDPWSTLLDPRGVFQSYVLRLGDKNLHFPGKAVAAFLSYIPSALWLAFLAYGVAMDGVPRLIFVGRRKTALGFIFGIVMALLGVVVAFVAMNNETGR